MDKIGTQRPKEDDREDPSGFLKKARLHQSKYRLEELKLLEYDEYGSYLSKNDAENGKNFYRNDLGEDVFKIFDAGKDSVSVKGRFPNFSKPLYQNMLRSAHIPFNMFIPLDKDKEYFKKIFNEIIGDKIKSIDLLKIEYVPEENYLNDDTSFDAYIEYTRTDGNKCIIGIEVKYTEREYKLSEKKDKKQIQEINNPESIYYKVTEKSDTYEKDCIGKLKEDNYRQIWRNHILGESIRQKDNDKFKDFISLTIYPEGNKHFGEMSKEYVKFLKNDSKYKCQFLTYEKLFELLDKYCPNEQYKHWIDYMRERYIVN